MRIEGKYFITFNPMKLHVFNTLLIFPTHSFAASESPETAFPSTNTIRLLEITLDVSHKEQLDMFLMKGSLRKFLGFGLNYLVRINYRIEGQSALEPNSCNHLLEELSQNQA